MTNTTHTANPVHTLDADARRAYFIPFALRIAHALRARHAVPQFIQFYTVDDRPVTTLSRDAHPYHVVNELFTADELRTFDRFVFDYTPAFIIVSSDIEHLNNDHISY